MSDQKMGVLTVVGITTGDYFVRMANCMTTTLYKYRILDSFKNFGDIILNNRLYAAPYTTLNDPMEGQYYYNRGELDRAIRENLRNEKGGLRICSLSRVNNNELMWSHYTNGQHGVAIGVQIDETRYDVRRVAYDGITTIRNEDYHSQTAREILLHKLDVWSYEEEERVFVEGNDFVDVVVTEVITGRAMKEPDRQLVRELLGRVRPDIRVMDARRILP